MKSTFMEKKETVKREWYVIDADGVTLGKLGTTVANLLRGKGKVTYTPATLTSDITLVATCVATTTTTPAPTIYSFTSYGSETDENEYATGTVKVVDESGEYTEIEIVENSVKDNDDFAPGKHFFVKTTIEDGQRRQLYVKGDGDTFTTIQVWVEVTPAQQ